MLELGIAPGEKQGLIFMVPIVLLVVWRLLDEEALLAENLSGYAEYQVQTPWRLIPGVF